MGEFFTLICFANFVLFADVRWVGYDCVELGFENFITSLLAKAIAVSRTRG